MAAAMKAANTTTEKLRLKHKHRRVRVNGANKYS